MSEQDKKPENNITALRSDEINMQAVADTLFNYLKDVIYNPAKASLDIAKLPPQFQNFGKGLLFFCNMVNDVKSLAKELAAGNLNCEVPPSGNEIAAPLKSLHASLKHLTWQSKQVAKGDYNQRVDFMGDFSEAFNDMVKQLEKRQRMTLAEKYKLEFYVSRLLANSPNPILLFDADERLVYVSDSYLANCECSDIDVLIGKTASELFAPFVSEEFLCFFKDMFNSAAREKKTLETEQKIDFKNSGVLRYYHLQVAPMTETDGTVKGSILILHDMTDIEKARREAEYAREQAERAYRAKSEFLARMSHEMLTPMNAIIGMTYLYNNSDVHENKDDCIKKIGSASNHLLSVINDILDMANIEADTLEIVNADFSFSSLIEQAIGAILFSADEKKQYLHKIIDPAIPEEIISDKKRISQLLINLLINAVKFTPEEGEITLSARLLSDAARSCVIRFSVSDTGIGISEEQQKTIFEAFEQVDGGVARRYGGTGLGLPISKFIVELMGGSIWVESELGRGTVFTFDVPVQKVEKSDNSRSHNESESQIEDTEETSTDENIFKGKRMLLVEDVDINREIIIALLEYTGLQIDTAEDGAEGIAKFEAAHNSYDLILTDINMPNIDGYELAKHIRASGLMNADTIPIVAMTANISREDVELCIASGMNSHLAKPIDMDALIGCLKKYL